MEKRPRKCRAYRQTGARRQQLKDIIGKQPSFDVVKCLAIIRVGPVLHFLFQINWQSYLCRFTPLLALAVIAVLSCATTSYAQSGDLIAERTDTLQVTGAGPFLIRPFLVENSVKIWTDGVLVAPEGIALDLRRGFVTFKNVQPDSAFQFVASYQFLPLIVEDSYNRWPHADLDSNNIGAGIVTELPPSSLRTTGSISRGILAGSNRDASIESGLRLQIEGDITPGVKVSAALTDENTPILPEGTTRRLDQFDKVFIQFESRHGRINLGDVETRIADSKFSSFQRKLQGITLQTRWLESQRRFVSGGSFQTAAAVSRGLFRSQTVKIVEGVQGPYRLEGGRGERFILILPGSEKVYMDGRLLERGLQNDYSIDYTTGELTFSARNMMGTDKRVQADFEYTTNQFTKTFVMGEGIVGFGRANGSPLFQLGVRAIREADGSQFSDEYGLSASDSLVISSAGDSGAFSSGARLVEYDSEALYTQYFRLTDASDGSDVFEAVRRPPAEGESVYRVTFSYFGSGQGSYVRSAGSSNGIVYEFVGSGNGNYEPVRQLPIPSRQDLFDLTLRSAIIAGVRLEGEWAISDHDKNRLSSQDSGDDTGRAHSFTIETIPISLGPTISFRGKSSVEKRSSSFVTFDRSRAIEFEREWNLPVASSNQTNSVYAGSSELSRSAEISVQAGDSTQITYARGDLNISDVFDAQRNTLDFQTFEQRWPEATFKRRTVSAFDLVSGERSNWTHLKGRIEKHDLVEGFHPFVGWEKESRLNPQGIQAQTPDYRELRVGLTHSLQFVETTLYAEERREEGIAGGPANTTRTFQMSANYHPNQSFRNSLNLGVRRSKLDSDGQSAQARNALVIGLDGEATVKRSNKIRWFYQAQSERSATLQEIYIRTGQERGQFIWDDVNGDDVIQLDEFIPETTPGEGEYVRTYFPSDSLENVTSVNASLRYEHLPQRNGSRIQRVRVRLLFEVDEKSRIESKTKLYALNQSAFRLAGRTIKGRIRTGQTFSFLPLVRERDLDFDFQQIQSMTDLSSGLETGRSRFYVLRLRQDFASKWSSHAQLTRSKEESVSSRFASRSFTIVSSELMPGLSYRLNDAIELASSPLYAKREDSKTDATAQIIRLPMDLRFTSATKFSLRAGIEYSAVEIDGDIAGLQSFEMTDGRGEGNSWLWNTTLEAKLTDIVRATFGYSGRAPASGNIIHTGRVQVSARF